MVQPSATQRLDDHSTVVLTIAGSDCSGGAGIQADLKTFAAHGCYGASVVTALTAQNTMGVHGVHPVPPEFVQQQIKSVLDDLDVKAIKTGMLYDEHITSVVAQFLKEHFSAAGEAGLPPLVCDPVLVSSGHTLFRGAALDGLISELFPICTVITPNTSETEVLLSRCGKPHTIETLEDMLKAAETLVNVLIAQDNNGSQTVSTSVLLKGGHITVSFADLQRLEAKQPDLNVVKQNLLSENMEILLVGSPDYQMMPLVVDVLYQKGARKTVFVRPRIDTKNTHGAGCTLSSAIASGLARGSSLETAIERAIVYTHLGIQAASPIGSGHGPLDHLHGISYKFIPKPSITNPYPFTHLLIESTAKSWKAYVEHEFVVQLGKGTLDRQRFVHFIKQDYLYLNYYTRASSFLAAKSSSFSAIASATQTVLNILQEVENHKAFCSRFAGISEIELHATPEASATTAYGSYLMDIGIQGDANKLMIALMACLLGYGEVGLWLKKQSATPDSWVVLEGNPYKSWMDEYASEHYQSAVKIGLETIEGMAVTHSPSQVQFNEWKDVWERCTKLEEAFWDMAMNLTE